MRPVPELFVLAILAWIVGLAAGILVSVALGGVSALALTIATIWPWFAAVACCYVPAALLFGRSRLRRVPDWVVAVVGASLAVFPTMLLQAQWNHVWRLPRLNDGTDGLFLALYASAGAAFLYLHRRLSD